MELILGLKHYQRCSSPFPVMSSLPFTPPHPPPWWQNTLKMKNAQEDVNVEVGKCRSCGSERVWTLMPWHYLYRESWENCPFRHVIICLIVIDSCCSKIIFSIFHETRIFHTYSHYIHTYKNHSKDWGWLDFLTILKISLLHQGCNYFIKNTVAIMKYYYCHIWIYFVM